MAFKRAEIRGILGESYTDAIGDKIFAAHLSVIDPLKDDLASVTAERDKYKAEAEKVAGLQKQLDEYKGGEDFKAKYEKEHTNFEDYKKKIADEAESAKVKAAYSKLLAAENISPKRIDAVLKVTDFSGMKLDKDGNLEGTDDLKKKINEDWADFKVITKLRNGKVETPPSGNDPSANNGGGMSRAAELAAKYHAQKYGVRKNEDKE